MKIILPLVLILVTSSAIDAQSLRARDIGIPLDGTPGDLNAITDVRGVEVGQEKEHVFDALNNARSGKVDEGSVWGGIILEQNDKTKWLAILLGTPDEAKTYLQNKERVEKQ